MLWRTNNQSLEIPGEPPDHDEADVTTIFTSEIFDSDGPKNLARVPRSRSRGTARRAFPG
jgi:hypothetical protein